MNGYVLLNSSYAAKNLGGLAFNPLIIYTMFQKKLDPFISMYLCFNSYELHENFQKYIGGVAHSGYG